MPMRLAFPLFPLASRPIADPPNFGLLMVFFFFFSLSPESAHQRGSSPQQRLHGGVEPGHQPLTAELGCAAGSASSSGLCWSQPRSARPGRLRPRRNKVRHGRGSLKAPGPQKQGWARTDPSAERAPPLGEQRAPGQGTWASWGLAVNITSSEVMKADDIC